MIALTLCLLATSSPVSCQEPPATASTPPVVVIDKDEHRRYILHAPAKKKAPKSGWKLLVVMPGGAGTPNFAPFVGNIRKNALKDDWLVAQMIAPVWSESQAKANVWPTKRIPAKKMKFTCEEFFADVLADVSKQHKLDPKYLFTLAWSSSGTLAYSLALAKKSMVTGTFIAMSVYKPDYLPSLKPAKGRRFHILHSPEDFIPIAMAEKARDELEKKGALVNYATYEGGHGWHGDVFGMMRTGFEWLERKAKKAKRPR